jgi:hypothetical protein
MIYVIFIFSKFYTVYLNIIIINQLTQSIARLNYIIFIFYIFLLMISKLKSIFIETFVINVPLGIFV